MRVLSTIVYASAFAYAACVLSFAIAKGPAHGAHFHHQTKVVSDLR